MIYILLVIGIVIILFGWHLTKKQEIEQQGLFKEVLVQEKDHNQEYIKLQVLLYDLKDQISSIEDKLDKNLMIDKGNTEDEVVDDLKQESIQKENKKDVSSDYNIILDEVKEMIKENKTVEEMAAHLNLGKGEVILLKNLLRN